MEKNDKKPSFAFKVISDIELSPDLRDLKTKNLLLSNIRSECCTRVCTRTRCTANEKQWNNFLEVNAGVVQY